MAIPNNDQGGNELYAVASKETSLRLAGCALFCLLPLVLVWEPLRSLLAHAFESEAFSQTPLIPLVSIFILYLNRRIWLPKAAWEWRVGTAVIISGAILLSAARLNFWHFSSTDQGIFVIFGMVIFWMGCFLLFFGPQAFRNACFPLLFLLFMVPIPEPILSKVIYSLQKESAEAAELFFRSIGIPYLRQGFIFALPGVTIRVAEECSGIRSTLALLITTVLISHFLLKSNWRRALVCVAIVPISILKNGLRIVTLSTLAIYVNPDFLYANLHHHGGIVFFVIGFVPLILMLRWLQRCERGVPA